MPEKYLSGKDVDTHFKNKEAYRKYMAYIHIHHIPHHKGKVVWIDGRILTNVLGSGFMRPPKSGLGRNGIYLISKPITLLPLQSMRSLKTED